MKFRNVLREKQRQQRLKALAEQRKAERPACHEFLRAGTCARGDRCKFRHTREAPARRQERAEEGARRQRQKARQQEKAKRPQPQRKRKKGRNQQILEEWDELAAEERLHKKLKKGKITKQEYEAAVLALDRDLIGK